MLLALNHLWGLHLPRQRLQQIGLAPGADVPIFYGDGTLLPKGLARTSPLLRCRPLRYLGAGAAGAGAADRRHFPFPALASRYAGDCCCLSTGVRVYRWQ